MKKGIIFKILFVLTIVIITISFTTTLVNQEKNKELIDKIRKYNLEQALITLNKRQELELNIDKEQMKNNLESIAKNSSLFLYADDANGLKSNLILDIRKNGIKAIEIYDDIMEESFLIAVKENNNIKFQKSISIDLNSYIKFKVPIYKIDNNIKEKLGSATLYYDESIIINKIDKIKDTIKSNINNFDITIDKELKELNRIQLFVSILSLIAVLITISILLIRYVSTPLNTLKKGLDDFFLFLQSKQDNVTKIDIYSNDEFGQMAHSLNDNIVVSAKLHEEIYELNVNLERRISKRTIDLELAKKEIEVTHKHTRDSIEYASLIQGALIPKQKDMTPFFKDHFVSWIPKDTVGGDIWLFNQLRDEDECLLFFIDCTGHGVPGAFVTMIVKSIEREIISNLKKHPEFDISPAIIMGYFNTTMKKLLKQEDKDSLSNAGLDGGIIYYNKKTQILKFCGAETPLFYIDKNKDFKTIKGNRYSVGYKKCDVDYEYKETILNVQEGMKFYCTTDGFLDQNGGEKDFPFGKKRFSNLIKEYHEESMADQQTVFLDEMINYENMIDNNDRNDDITLIAFEIGKS